MSTPENKKTATKAETSFEAEGQPATEALPAEQEASEFPLSIAEFCSRLSASDRRVELIGAFHHAETSAQRVKDLASSYQTRFEEFVNAPA